MSPSGAETATRIRAPPARDSATTRFLGAPTRVIFETDLGHLAGEGTETYTTPTTKDGTATRRVLALDVLFFPLFILIRWFGDVFFGGSMGRKLGLMIITRADGQPGTERALATHGGIRLALRSRLRFRRRNGRLGVREGKCATSTDVLGLGRRKPLDPGLSARRGAGYSSSSRRLLRQSRRNRPFVPRSAAVTTAPAPGPGP